MSDVFSKEERSQIMRSVKSRDTKSTELALIKLFKENHITGWRRTYTFAGATKEQIEAIVKAWEAMQENK